MLFVRTYLHKEQVELDGVVAIHILVREKELLSESQHGGLLDALLPETLVWVQPVHYTGGGEGRGRGGMGAIIKPSHSRHCTRAGGEGSGEGRQQLESLQKILKFLEKPLK